jgi:hypothetical protein
MNYNFIYCLSSHKIYIVFLYFTCLLNTSAWTITNFQLNSYIKFHFLRKIHWLTSEMDDMNMWMDMTTPKQSQVGIILKLTAEYKIH